MQDIWDFHRWLVGRVRADFPNLHIVALIAGEPEYRAASYVLEKNLTDRFGEAAKKPLDLLLLRRAAREYDSMAHKLFHINTPQGSPSVGLAEVNLHQAQFLHATDSPHHAKATLAHEIAHLLSGYHYPDHSPWMSLHEETAADLFEGAVMAAYGVKDHHDHLVFRRLRSRFNDAALSMSSYYGYAAVAEEGRALAAKYAKADPATLSPKALRKEVEDIVWRNRDRLQQWQDFTIAAHKAGSTHSRAGLPVLRALAQDHPIARDMEKLAAFDPATMDKSPANRSLRMQRYEAEKAAIPKMNIPPFYYIAINDSIVDGNWPQRNLAAKPTVR